MVDEDDDSKALRERGEDLYRNGMAHTLAGFQLIEDSLKTYIELHFDFVRKILAGRLHFEFSREDYKEAALGRLVQVFSKLCADKKLVLDLRAAVGKRDHIAHQALLKLYQGVRPKAEDYVALLGELQADMDLVKDLFARVHEEAIKLHEATRGNSGS